MTIYTAETNGRGIAAYDGVEEPGAAGLSAAHVGRRCPDCEYLPGRHQYTPGAPRARGPIRRRGRQGHGQPGVAQGEERLGHVERPLTRRRTDRAADSRRHGGARSARPQSDLHLAARRHRRARGRPEGPAGDQEHGRRECRGLAHRPRRSHHARPQTARVPPRRRRAGAREGDCRRLGRCAGPAVQVHKHRNLLAHAPERLHDEVTADYTDMIYATTREEIEARRKAFIRKWRLKHRAVADSLEEASDRLFTFTRLPPSQWRSARTTNAIERLLLYCGISPAPGNTLGSIPWLVKLANVRKMPRAISGRPVASVRPGYPSRLQVELRTHFRRDSIQVMNRGVGGEEAPQMLARFGRGVMPEKPDLVLWQVGSNAVLRGHDVVKIAEVIREGVGQLKAIGADVILIDPQFAPRVIEKPDTEQMVALIAATAKRQNVDLFRRFAVMRYWREVTHDGKSAKRIATSLGV